MCVRGACVRVYVDSPCARNLGTGNNSGKLICDNLDKMLSYRRETALQGVL